MKMMPDSCVLVLIELAVTIAKGMLPSGVLGMLML